LYMKSEVDNHRIIFSCLWAQAAKSLHINLMQLRKEKNFKLNKIKWLLIYARERLQPSVQFMINFLTHRVTFNP
jgi:hypothetical protein